MVHGIKLVVAGAVVLAAAAGAASSINPDPGDSKAFYVIWCC